MVTACLSSATFQTEVLKAATVFDVAQLTAPTSSKVTAAVVRDGMPHPFLKLGAVIVSDVKEEVIFADSFDSPPGQPPTGQVVFSLVEVGRSDGATPLSVKARQVIGVTVEVLGFPPDTAQFTGTLILKGEGWDDASIPLTFAIATAFECRMAPDVIVVEQGKSASARLTVKWLAGPAKSLTFELIADAEASGIHMDPVRVLLSPSETRTLDVILRVDPDAVVANHLLRIVVDFPGREQLVNCIVVPPPQPVEIEPVLRRQLLVEHMHRHYLRAGGSKGPLGYPVGAVRMNGNIGTRRYAGGDLTTVLKPTLGDPELTTAARAKFKCRIVFRGARCIRKASSDQLSSTNEPYFLITVESSDGTVAKVHKFDFENIISGSVMAVHKGIAENLTPNPMRIAVRGYENDFGDPDKTAANIQTEAVKVAQAFEAIAASAGAAAADGPGAGPAAGAATVSSVFAGPLGALAAVAFVSALGLGDDFVGQGAASLFDKPEQEASSPPKLGEFDGGDYNVRIVLDGVDEGVYELFFEVIVTFHPAPITV